ncbi:hypothetical protein [Leptospira alexanderi]|uniref:hypothetical protein n=1 Tax=Leptospira alexanderi TaxID=100053 RepID=UPI00099131C3|nr:hypothetical protein [Leptospira alexanderi]
MKLRKTLICFVSLLLLFQTVSCDIRDPNYKPFGLEVTRDPDGEIVFIVPKKGKTALSQIAIYDLEDAKNPNYMWVIFSASREWKNRFRYGEENISKKAKVEISPRKLIKGRRYYFYVYGHIARGEEEEIEFVY